MDAVFISDLHLHPDNPKITERFERFLAWVTSHTRTLYILGDFFHVWAGDDTFDAWSNAIAAQLAHVSAQGVRVYFMRGNRDFLVGRAFAKRAHLTLLDEPTVIELGGERVVLMHGDAYCTQDKPHQWFRRLTRNRWFSTCFLALPKQLRVWIVTRVRTHSATNPRKQPVMMDVVPASLTRHLEQCNVGTVVHGHTHRPGHTEHDVRGVRYHQYVLSDWDASPSILCYDNARRFYFKLLSEGYDHDG
jgi:UDP-2,3-diacylglucosamine hydrolase